VLLLGMRHQPSPYWLTFRQALERGGNVRKGEKGATVVKYGQFKPKGQAVKEEQPAADDSKQKKRMFLREYTVFNACQIDGIDFPAVSPTQVMNRDERIAAADQIIAGMPNPPIIREGAGSRACYSAATDTVTMPPFGTFESAETFYHTLYHEVCHASGHPSRLNRESLVKHDEFGGSVYSQEELVAEMGAAFLGLEADIVRDQHEQSAAYLQSWLDVLRVTEHKRWIVNAAAQATKAVDYVLDRQAVLSA
jgi:antirestriction protein ArdC